MDQTIKEVQELCHVSRKAIRYYEQVGLLEIKRDNKKMMLDETNIKKLIAIRYYRTIGLETSIIQILFAQSNKEEVLQALDAAYRNLEEEYMTYKKQQDIIENIIDNLNHGKIRSDDCEALLALHEQHKILDVVMVPYRSMGSYYRLQEVEFTQKKYHLLQWIMRCCLLFAALLLCCMIYTFLQGETI